MRLPILFLLVSASLYSQCSYTGTISAVGTSSPYDNSAHLCNTWSFSYVASGFTKIIFSIEYAPNQAVPNFTTWMGTGTNPDTTTVGTNSFSGIPAYVRVNLIYAEGHGGIMYILTGTGSGGGGSTGFSDLTSGTNNAATMVVTTGASLAATSGGIITATSILGGGITGTNSIPSSTLPIATPTNFGATKITGTSSIVTSFTGVTHTSGATVIFDGSGNLLDSGNAPVLVQVVPPASVWLPLLSAGNSIVGSSLALTNPATPSKIATALGATTTNDCAKWDVSGNVVDSGSPCGGGGSSPLTTKGDLFTFSTVSARLPVGTDNYTLISDSSQTTGLKWVATPAITTGPTGGLDCTSFGANTCDLVTSVVPLLANAETVTGAWRFDQLRVHLYIVSALPTCNSGAEGQTEGITDGAATPVYQAIAAGSGSVHMKVYCNGTNWIND